MKSLSIESKIRVRYGETDQMGYVHHAQLALYLEEGRMDLFRKVGIDVSRLEKEGILLPVARMELRFKHPMRFGDVLSVVTRTEAPWDPGLVFRSRVYNQDKTLTASARVILVFADRETGALLQAGKTGFPDLFPADLKHFIIHP